MIKYILWDIDGTLLDFDYGEKLALEACFKDFSLGDLSSSMLEDYKKINVAHWEMLERGLLSKGEVLTGRFYRFFEKYDLDTSVVEDLNRSFQNYLGEFTAFCPFAEDLVRGLRGTVYQFGATNGTIKAQKGKLKKSGLDNILDRVFISDEVGFDKPNIEFFNEIFSYTKDDKRDNYIIVGDSLTSDMEGGKRAGIKTCWYNPKKKANKTGLMVDYEIEDLREVGEILLENRE